MTGLKLFADIVEQSFNTNFAGVIMTANEMFNAYEKLLEDICDRDWIVALQNLPDIKSAFLAGKANELGVGDAIK